MRPLLTVLIIANSIMLGMNIHIEIIGKASSATGPAIFVASMAVLFVAFTLQKVD